MVSFGFGLCLEPFSVYFMSKVRPIDFSVFNQCMDQKVTKLTKPELQDICCYTANYVNIRDQNNISKDILHVTVMHNIGRLIRCGR